MTARLLKGWRYDRLKRVASEADKDLTARIRASGDIVGIPLLDHIIFARKDYFSFVENGML